MAKSAQSGTVKSPVNLAIGVLLKSLREQHGWKIEQAARSLGVSPAYLNTIESGVNALPAKAVAGLDALGVDFLAASALLTLISYLDCRVPNSRFYDFEEIQLRAEKLLAAENTAPFHPFLEWVAAVIRRSGTEKIGADVFSESVEILKVALSEVASLKPSAPPSQSFARINRPLSPIFEDVLEILESRLALFTPHIDRQNFKLFEERHASRILEIRAYVDDAGRFIDDAPNFDWSAILLNAHSPKLTIFIPSVASQGEDELAGRFVNGLPFTKVQTEIVRPRIAFVKVSSGAQNDINRALVHDFARGRVVSDKIWKQFGEEILVEKKYTLFNNSWLYEMQSSVKLDAKLLIGTLGAYNDSDGSAFGVMMDRYTSELWWRLTEITLHK
jgi:transcriptional regulator with XRE-family HTH domain